MSALPIIIGACLGAVLAGNKQHQQFGASTMSRSDYILGGDDPETLRQIFGGDDVVIGGFFDDIASAAKSVVKSPLTKAVAGGIAFVLPPVGVPLAAGVVAADQIVRAAESKVPKKRETGRGIIKRSVKLAKTGDVAAVRAVSLLKKTAKLHIAKNRKAKAPTTRKDVAKAKALQLAQKVTAARGLHEGFVVTKAGRILRGKFRAA